jgi:peptide methionine sulfoxide reductase msrA/msrB
LQSKQQLEDSNKFTKPIAVEIISTTPFYTAESYHQNYYKKNTDQYNRYKKGSGREDYIYNTRKNIPKNVSVTEKNPWNKTPLQIEQAIKNLSPQQKKILFE